MPITLDIPFLKKAKIRAILEVFYGRDVECEKRVVSIFLFLRQTVIIRTRFVLTAVLL
jgi:hypothetical protein